jgi:hypothetical protein
MGKKTLFVGKLTILLLTGLLVFCCDNGTNNSNGNNTDDYENPGGVTLTGTYGRYAVSSSTYNDRIVFTATTYSSTFRNGAFVSSGAYKYDGAILTITINGVKHNLYANLTGTTITISGSSAYSEYFNGIWTIR